MSIWKTAVTPQILNDGSSKTILQHLDIKFTEVGDDYLKATMPVDHRTVQPMRILHGGASVVLAETLGSVASMLAINTETHKAAVGIEINANHLKSAYEGDTVTGVVRPIRIGSSLHVWEIKIYDGADNLCCVSRLSCMCLKH